MAEAVNIQLEFTQFKENRMVNRLNTINLSGIIKPVN